MAQREIKLKPFSLKEDNMEVRTTDKNLVTLGELTTAEILMHQEFGSYTLASWKEEESGFNLVFVGERPFGKNVNPKTFMKLAKYGQKKLEKYWKANND
jgi:hypothetical protein